MKKKLLKVMISVLLVASVMTAMVSVANAETSKFNVTATHINGWDPGDPLSPRAQKSYDGDTKYYVTVTSMSGGCYFVEFYMNHYKYIHKNKNNKEYETYFYPLVYLRSSVGECRTQTYDGDAPGGHYYFLEMVPYYGYCNINCKGRFTP